MNRTATGMARLLLEGAAFDSRGVPAVSAAMGARGELPGARVV